MASSSTDTRNQMRNSFTLDDVPASELPSNPFSFEAPAAPAPSRRHERSLSDEIKPQRPPVASNDGTDWLRFVIDTLKQTSLVAQDLDEAVPPLPAEFTEVRNLRHHTAPLSAAIHAPRIFRRIQSLFGLGRSSFYQSWELTEERMRVGAGRSGSLFFKSANHRFLLKTVSPKEAKQLTEILPNYYAHMHKYAKETNLLRIYGLWWFSAPGSLLGVYAIVFNNLFYTPANPTGRFIVKFDLKGRAPKPGKAGRYVDQPKFQHVFKDTDVVHSLLLSPLDRASILASLKSDTDFLCANNLMDYSLLIGIRPVSGLRRVSPKEDATHPLWGMIDRNDVAAAQQFLTAEKIPDLIHPQGGNTFLQLATWNRRYAIVSLLLAAGAPVDERNFKGITALHLAAAKGSKKLCQLLINHGADVNALSVLGNTPLHRARLHDRIALCNWLITEQHADPHIKNIRGEVAFENPPASQGMPGSVYDAHLPKTYILADQKAVLSVGVIDFLCYFGYRKGAEYRLKRLYGWSQESISVNPPDFYARRFLRYSEKLFLHPDDLRREEALLEMDTLLNADNQSLISFDVLPGNVLSQFGSIFKFSQDSPPASPTSSSSQHTPPPSSFFGSFRAVPEAFLTRMFQKDSAKLELSDPADDHDDDTTTPDLED